MGRISRVVLPGIAHHVSQRGVRSMDVFQSNEDRREYLRLMAEQCERAGVRILAYCLMSNHVHLVAVPRESDGLAHGIGEAHRRYTQVVNLRQGVRGYLFQGRFHSCPLDKKHLIAAIRYVERNPVRANLARQAWEYPWSSAAFRVGVAVSDPLVARREVGGLDVDWRRLLKSDPTEIAFLRKRLRTGRPCGSDRFVRKAERLTHRVLQPRPPGRPPRQPPLRKGQRTHDKRTLPVRPRVARKVRRKRQ